jgi:hypothetical protein
VLELEKMGEKVLLLLLLLLLLQALWHSGLKRGEWRYCC